MEIDLINAFYCLANDVGVDPYTIGYCLRRLRSEGYKFLTVTLPKLGKAVLRSLEVGYFDPVYGHSDEHLGFSRKRQSLRVFPKFLNKIFDPRTGRVLNDPDALAILQLRHVCEYFYKLALPFEEDQIESATRKFVKTDSEVPGVGGYDYEYVDGLRKDFETYFSSVTESEVHTILSGHAPRSGPGTFALKDTYEQYAGEAWYTRKESENSCPDTFRNFAYASKTTSSKGAWHEPNPAICCEPGISEVLFVPKDSRGPRTICREPYSRLRYQMAFNAYLSKCLTGVTRGRINFRDQQVNQRLAKEASLSREWSTFDLKDASDSVSAAIVSHLFRNAKGLRHFLHALRSTHALLPDKKLIRLQKLAGMGSGFTFPTMSLLIYLTVVKQISRYMPYKDAMRVVYVYGDDLIVPTRYAHVVEPALSRVGLKLNVGKSFVHSHFRESCGGDFFKGQDVAPARIKLSHCKLKMHADNLTLGVHGPNALINLERHCRVLVEHGLLKLAEYYYSLIERKYGKLPLVYGESPVIGRYSLQPIYYDSCPDNGGAYRTVRVLLPIPASRRFSKNPWVHLAHCLKGSQNSDVLDRLLVPSRGSKIDEVNIPRTVRYKRVSVSAFRLMG